MILEEYQYRNVSSQTVKEVIDFFFNKDETDNNCLHYAYMVDLPDVRTMIRKSGYSQNRARKLNRRGQLPQQLRHAAKQEDSEVETSSDEDLDAKE